MLSQMRVLAAATAIVLFATAPLRCQMPAPGSRVRVVEAGRVIQAGRLLSWVGDTLAIGPDSGSAAVAMLTLTRARRLEVPTGFRRLHAVRGLAIGAGVGLVAGVVLGLATYEAPSCANNSFCLDLGPEFSAAAGGGLGLLAGSLIGVIAGASSSSEEWRSVTRSPIRPIVTPAAGAVRLGVSLAF